MKTDISEPEQRDLEEAAIKLNSELIQIIVRILLRERAATVRRHDRDARKENLLGNIDHQNDPPGT